MKATVMESENGKSVVLTEEGIFCSVQGDYAVGQVIEYSQRTPVRAERRRLVRRAAAVACMILALGFGTVAVMDPAAAVTVSIGDEYPVQYVLDKDGNVLRVKATDESGEELAKQLTEEGVRGKEINTAIDMTERILGSSYDAAAEPPEVEGRDADIRDRIADEIIEHHTAAEKTARENAAEELPGQEEPDAAERSVNNSSSHGENAVTGAADNSIDRSEGITEEKGSAHEDAGPAPNEDISSAPPENTGFAPAENAETGSAPAGVNEFRPGSPVSGPGEGPEIKN